MQYRSCVILALGGMYLALGAAAVLAQSVKLSGPMAPGPRGQVYETRFTADGTRVVYSADGYGGTDLFVGFVNGSKAAEALTTLGENRFVGDFQITQDGERVLYVAGTIHYQAQLYGMPLDGSQPPVQLSQLPGGGGIIFDVQVDRQGNRALYTAEEITGVRTLFSVPIDGSAPAIRISRAMDGDVTGFQISPDGTTAVYVAESERFRLFRVPMDGSASPIQLSRADLYLKPEFLLDPQGTRVVYQARVLSFYGYRMYSVPLDGSAGSQLLSPAFAHAEDPRITPDGRTVLYRSALQLFRVPIDGRPHRGHAAKPGRIRERVNGPLVPGGLVYEYELSPDGTRVVYRAFQSPRTGLYSVPLFDASAWVRLSGDLGAGPGFQVSPDGTRVVFKSFPDVYSVPIEGGTAPVLVAPGADEYSVTADGTSIVFLAGSPPQLFGVPPSGGQPPIPLNLPSLGSQVHDVTPSPVGQRVIYRSDEGTDQNIELFSVPADGNQLPVLVNAALPLGPSRGDVREFEVAPDGSHVAYLVDQEGDGQRELYGVSTSNGAPATDLSDVLPGRGVYTGFRFSPDATQVYFVSNRELLFLLWSVPVDGSTAPTVLTSNSARQVFQPFQLTPDGSQAVYLSTEIEPGQIDIFSVPTDGSLQSVRLSTSLPAGADVQGDFLITPDGERAVYRVVPNGSGQFDLYSARVAGGEVPHLISSNVADTPRQFAPASNGARVLFRSRSVPTRLHSVLADGSLPAVQLSPAGLHVDELGATLSGARVAFSAGAMFSAPTDGSQPALVLDADPPQTFYGIEVVGGAVFYGGSGGELRGAAMNGSQGPTTLSAPMVAGGVVQNFGIVGSLGRAVYLADQDVDEVVELYSVPTNGSRISTRLNAPLVPGGQVTSFLISLDGSEVVYCADQDQDEVYELYVVPTLGGTPARLNGPLVADGDVLRFEVGAAGRVFYLADEDTDEVTELYMSWP